MTKDTPSIACLARDILTSLPELIMLECGESESEVVSCAVLATRFQETSKNISAPDIYCREQRNLRLRGRGMFRSRKVYQSSFLSPAVQSNGQGKVWLKVLLKDRWRQRSKVSGVKGLGVGTQYSAVPSRTHALGGQRTTRQTPQIHHRQERSRQFLHLRIRRGKQMGEAISVIFKARKTWEVQPTFSRDSKETTLLRPNDLSHSSIRRVTSRLLLRSRRMASTSTLQNITPTSPSHDQAGIRYCR